MSTAELKINLIQRISNLQELRVIEELKDFLDFELSKTEYKLNSAQKNRIVEAQKDEILTEEQANSEIEQWLSEK